MTADIKPVERFTHTEQNYLMVTAQEGPWVRYMDHQLAIDVLRAEVERLQRQLRQAHKDYGCELRDPNGTIWEYAAAQKARAEQMAEALRGIAEPLDCGCKPCTGTCRYGAWEWMQEVANDALLRDQEEGK